MNSGMFINNRKKISDYMKENSLLVMFAGTAPHKSADAMYQFTPSRNFYYLTGIDDPEIILMITKINNKVKETLFLEKSDPIKEKWVGKKLAGDEAKELSGIEDIQYIEGFYDALDLVLSRKDINTLYVNLEQLKWNLPLDEAHEFSKEIIERHPYLKVENIFHAISKHRVIKNDEELDNIRKAIDITNNGISGMMKNVKPGMMEYELEAYLDFAFTSAGEKEHGFYPIIASGANATTLHYEENNCKIENDSLVLVDVGAQYGYYSADISRTFPASGKFTERQKTIYNIVLKALNETIKVIKPGTPFADLNETTKKVLSEECKNIGLIKEDSELSKYYYHGVSHHLGLNTHDVGDRDAVLEKGMVLTVEPGLYIEDEKIGIRIEDDVVVTDNGCDNLSSHIIKTVEEIEAFMAK